MHISYSLDTKVDQGKSNVIIEKLVTLPFSSENIDYKNHLHVTDI